MAGTVKTVAVAGVTAFVVVHVASPDPAEQQAAYQAASCATGAGVPFVPDEIELAWKAGTGLYRLKQKSQTDPDPRVTVAKVNGAVEGAVMFVKAFALAARGAGKTADLLGYEQGKAPAPVAPQGGAVVPIQAGAQAPTAVAPVGVRQGGGGWAPPQLNNPQTVQVPVGGGNVNLGGGDYVLQMPDQPVQRGITIQGGTNVVLVGGEIRDDGSANDHSRAIHLKETTGTVHIEGVLFTGAGTEDVITMQLPGSTTVQLQNLRVESIAGLNGASPTDSGQNHGDFVQTWSGPGVLRMDGLHADDISYQGFYLESEKFGPPIRQIEAHNIYLNGAGGSGVLLWNRGFPINASNIWIETDGTHESVIGEWPGVREGRADVLTGTPGIGYAPGVYTPSAPGATVAASPACAPTACDTAQPGPFVNVSTGATEGPGLARSAAAAAGFTGADLDIAVGVAGAESSFNPAAVNNANSNGSSDHGMWQINSVHAEKLAAGDWSDPYDNAVMAKAVWDEAGGSWNPWVAFKSGAYLEHMPAGAGAAAADPCVVPVTEAHPAGEAGPWGGHENGRIPTAALCAPETHPGKLLRCDAASSFDRMAGEFEAAVGQPLQLTDGYRTYEGQVACREAKGDMCAVPGTSNHGWALAADLGSGVNDFGTPGHEWMRANGARFGWVHPDWAQQGGSKPEPWHWEYTGGDTEGVV